MRNVLSACLVIAIGLFAVTAQTQTPQPYKVVPGDATDVAVGSDGSVWIVGAKTITTAERDGYEVLKKAGTGWENISLTGIGNHDGMFYGDKTDYKGGAFKIAIDLQGNPWIINGHRNVYRRLKNTWQIIKDSRAEDIAIGKTGAVWIVTPNNDVATWDGSKFVKYIGKDLTCGLSSHFAYNSCSRITVDSFGNPWVIDDKSVLYRSTDMKGFFTALQRGDAEPTAGWETMPGKFSDVGAGADGSVFAVTTTPYQDGGQVSVWDAEAWKPLEVGGTNIAADSKGFPWIVNSSNKILTDARNTEPLTLAGAALKVNDTWRQEKSALTLKDVKFSKNLGGTISFTLEFLNQDPSLVTFKYNLTDLVTLVSNNTSYHPMFDQKTKCATNSASVASGEILRLTCLNDAGGMVNFKLADATIKQFVVTVSSLVSIQNARWLVPVKR